jgi:DNA replication protein DnaC
MNDFKSPFSPDIVEFDCPTHGIVNCLRFGSPARHVPSCPKCGEEAVQKLHRERREESRIAWEKARIEAAKLAVPERYQAANLADFAPEVFEKVQSWIRTCAEIPGGLIVVGPVGTGKTHLAAAITRELILTGKDARYTSQAAYLREIRRTWDKNVTDTEAGIISEFVSPRILVLDDIGAARANENDTLRLGELIGERYDEMRPCVFVTNLRPDQLKAEVGDRTYDRMRDGAVTLVLNGQSRRKLA